MNFKLRTDESAKIQNIVTEWPDYLSVNVTEKSTGGSTLFFMGILAPGAGFYTFFILENMLMKLILKLG
ncbi:hypothetical protein [Chryseobacterium sp. c4a]|uniref:hypothetical protein n=1 Tax=Chryseobacterium sp. c4a TaxID=1573582 RepID=UPI00135AE9F6|nr:hypothetical protein [Chryseobacterium sp. c4a]